MKEETIKVLWISGLIVALEGWALYLGVNETVLALVFGGLCGLGGYEINNLVKELRGDRDKRRTA